MDMATKSRWDIARVLDVLAAAVSPTAVEEHVTGGVGNRVHVKTNTWTSRAEGVGGRFCVERGLAAPHMAKYQLPYAKSQPAATTSLCAKRHLGCTECWHHLLTRKIASFP